MKKHSTKGGTVKFLKRIKLNFQKKKIESLKLKTQWTHI